MIDSEKHNDILWGKPKVYVPSCAASALAAVYKQEKPLAEAEKNKKDHGCCLVMPKSWRSKCCMMTFVITSVSYTGPKPLCVKEHPTDASKVSACLVWQSWGLAPSQAAQDFRTQHSLSELNIRWDLRTGLVPVLMPGESSLLGAFQCEYMVSPHVFVGSVHLHPLIPCTVFLCLDKTPGV